MKAARGRSLETLFTLLIFGVFGLSAMLLTLLGANAYRGIARRMNANNALRSSLSYVANKVRAGDEAGGISVVERDGMPLLCLRETVEGAEYVTCIYFSDGWVREYATVAGNEDFDAESGEKVAALADFQIARAGRKLTLTARAEDGAEQSLCVALRCEIS